MAQTAAIDISQWQGTINWSAVPQPIAVIKMSGGDAGLYTDSMATVNYYGAKKAGKAVAGYHFAGGGDPTNEADFFIAAMSPLEQDDVMVLDWEIPHGDPVGWCTVFVNRVHDRTGVWPMIYMNLATLNSFNWKPVTDNCGLWLAAWNNDPNANLTDKFYVMHQYTSNGSVAGISGRVDLDMFYGTVAQFKKYGYQVPKRSDPEPTAPPVVVSPVVTTPEPTPVPPVTVPDPVVVAPVPTPVNQDDQGVAIFKRAFHTFWQSFLAIFAASVTGLLSQLANVNTFSDAKALGLSLVVAAGAAVLSAIKNTFKKPEESK